MRTMGERLSPAGVGMVTVAVAVFGWIGYELNQWPGEPPRSTIATAEDASDATEAGATDAPDDPTAEPTPVAPSRPQRFALLSDGLAITEGSWFDRVIRDRAVDAVRPGAIASQAGLGAAALAPRAELAANADVLLVQAGTIDLLNGTSPDQVTTAVQDLLQTAVDLGGPDGGPEVVWVTVPPLGAQPAAVLTVNQAVTAWAERNDVTVWDLTTPVATPTGAWRPGFTIDGIAPSEAGQQAQAAAARRLATQTVAGAATG